MALDVDPKRKRYLGELPVVPATLAGNALHAGEEVHRVCKFVSDRGPDSDGELGRTLTPARVSVDVDLGGVVVGVAPRLVSDPTVCVPRGLAHDEENLVLDELLQAREVVDVVLTDRHSGTEERIAQSRMRLDRRGGCGVARHQINVTRRACTRDACGLQSACTSGT